jgi:SagB-type dehydrogenase family enzyme
MRALWRRSMGKKMLYYGALLAILLSCATPSLGEGGRGKITTGTGEPVTLPSPGQNGGMNLTGALARRRSVRAFSDQPLTDQQLSQLLWAAQGITDGEGHRTAPSAGALYPLEVYVAMAIGVYHYEPRARQLSRILDRDPRPALYQAALRQEAIREAPVVFVITAVYARTEQRYGVERGTRYVHLEAGHAAQNVLLQATALGLGAVPIGSFSDSEIRTVLTLPEDHAPLYLIPVGKPR